MEGNKRSKTIYLIRHAESENNVSKRAFRESLGRRRPPSWAQVRAMAPMLTFPMNTPLSQTGVRQVWTEDTLFCFWLSRASVISSQSCAVQLRQARVEASENTDSC